MKKLLIPLFVLLTMAPVSALDYHYQVPRPLLDRDGNLNAEQMFIAGEVGAPALPLFPVKILLPSGTKAERVTVQFGELVELGQPLLPAIQEQFPFSRSDEAVITEREPEIWSQYRELPAGDIDQISTQYLGGHSILLATVHPVRYNPVTRQLNYYTDFTLQVTLTSADCRFAPSPEAEERVTALVDNPEALVPAGLLTSRTEAYDYLIVTSAELSLTFQQLADWHNSLGRRTRIMLIGDLLETYGGLDETDQLRNGLIAQYQQTGFRYLLLAGDIDQLPYRELYVDTQHGTSDHLPSDLYFAGLDGTWNNDGDPRWGEPGEEDWMPELSVGRASVSNQSEAASFVNKQIGYQQSPVEEELIDYLMVGEQLDSNPTWGGDCKDEIIEGSNLHGLETTGFPSHLATGTLYDRHGEWSADQLFELLGQGVNVTNHLGHCNWNYLMKMHLDDITDYNFTADGESHSFHVGYSQGCIAGAFEENDCAAEMVTNIENGYAAFIANSRYGWYQPGGTGGSSQLFDREFFDAVFGEEISQIGDALQDSRMDLILLTINDRYLRWVYYELNLFGDPALHIWSDTPHPVGVSYSDSLLVGAAGMELQVMVEGGSNENMLVALARDGVIHGSALTSGNGQAEIEFDEPLLQSGEYQLVVSGWNCLPAQYPLQVVPPAGPYLTMTGYELSDDTGNGNGLADAGEELEMTITLANIGSTVATGVNAMLSCNSDFVDVSLGAVTLADIPPGEELAATVPFQLTVAENTPDLTTAECSFTIWCNGGAWTEVYALVIHAAVPEIVELSIADDDNGRLDPGETAWLSVMLTNSGSSTIEELVAQLSSDDQWITILDGEDTMPILAPGNQDLLLFQITASAETVPGHGPQFRLDLNGQPGLDLQLDFVIVVGEQFEGFETGDFSSLEWETGGDSSWQVVTDNPAEGTCCARSGTIDDDQHSWLRLEQFVPVTATVSFQRRVSSQHSGDWLRFRIDDEVVGEWSGQSSWAEVAFEVAPGWHSFEWSYEKNGWNSSGNDCGWIDAIALPPRGEAQPPLVETDVDVISVTVINGDDADYELQIGNGGDMPLDFSLSFMEAETRDFADDMENGEGEWTHEGEFDNWHLTQQRSHSADHAWYVGVEGNWEYEANSFCRLITPSFFIPNDAYLRFWHWGSLESDDGGAHDAGLVELSVNGGDWQLVEPAGGYHSVVSDDVSNPLPPGTPCFSGYFEWWREELINLSSWAGSHIRVSFLFASDDEVNLEGWYIDDLEVVSAAPEWISYQPGSGTVPGGESESVYFYFDGSGHSDVVLTGTLTVSSNDPANPQLELPVEFQVGLESVDPQQPMEFELAQNYPNPFNPTTSIAFSLPQNCEVRLDLFDLQGRHVRQLLSGEQPAGEQVVLFDAGELSAGVYFYRLEAEQFSVTRKMLLVK